ncbi:hypothetical protein AAV94_01825 [Lampropedia cohaerens]|uniref:Roadblock/LAMTOR2 domain-containing protein n=1 Tax=Lampropedia cohaerens TaxID=1610491 RepID=A0A0U1Q302_9BURK|nr:hypothetical protein [Lampropedia cohaerens]KKW69148.1 hypothetical protein AAV94_01825 [Lampropedia cohaerens]
MHSSTDSNQQWKARFGAMQAAIDELPGQFPAVQGCALVEVASGMVVHSVGSLLKGSALAEAASDYWRHYQRHSSFFEALGPLRYCVLMHAQQRITILPCSEAMVLVLVTRDGVAIDWASALQRAGEIGALLRTL